MRFPELTERESELVAHLYDTVVFELANYASARKHSGEELLIGEVLEGISERLYQHFGNFIDVERQMASRRRLENLDVVCAYWFCGESLKRLEERCKSLCEFVAARQAPSNVDFGLINRAAQLLELVKAERKRLEKKVGVGENS